MGNQWVSEEVLADTPLIIEYAWMYDMLEEVQELKQCVAMAKASSPYNINRSSLLRKGTTLVMTISSGRWRTTVVIPKLTYRSFAKWCKRNQVGHAMVIRNTSLMFRAAVRWQTLLARHRVSEYFHGLSPWKERALSTLVIVFILYREYENSILGLISLRLTERLF